MSISNKVVAITGGGSGIGRATALLLAERGAQVVVGGRREAELLKVVKEIEATGGQAICTVTDVTKRTDVQAMVDAACDRFGRLDVLVSSAGIGPVARFDALDVDDWDAMIDINFRGVLHGIAAALPVFQRQKDGHFVNVLSLAGVVLLPTMGVYAATKNAARTVTEVLRQEAGPDLRVTEVSPGMVATDFTASITNQEQREAIRAWGADMAIPPEAIARAIAFAIEQPRDVDVNNIAVRPTAQKE